MTDDDLRSRLRRADPAAALPPLPPDRIAQLVGDTMTAAPLTTRRPARPRSIWLVAAGLVLIAAAGLTWKLTRPPEITVNTLTGVVPSSAPAVVNLTVPAGASAKCREPQPSLLAGNADFAFAGTVAGITGDVVTLEVTKVYKGAPAGVVQVPQEGRSSETMMGSGKFETGRKYLVAASGGQILICGYSGEADAPGLRELFDKAF